MRNTGRRRWGDTSLPKKELEHRGNRGSEGERSVGNEEGKATNYSEAAEALRKLKQENPAQARGLKILRRSELPES